MDNGIVRSSDGFLLAYAVTKRNGVGKQARRLIHADGTMNTTAARELPMVYSVGVIKTATKAAQICER